MDEFPDLGSLSDQELKDQIRRLLKEEHEVSYRRHFIHGHLDALRAELVRRTRRAEKHGDPGTQPEP